MEATKTERFMELTTFIIPGRRIGDYQIQWKCTVLGPNATARLLSLIPDNRKIEDEFVFIRDNYEKLVDVIYPSILEPKIPKERIAIGDVQSLLFPLMEQSGIVGEDNDDTKNFRPE